MSNRRLAGLTSYFFISIYYKLMSDDDGHGTSAPLPMWRRDWADAAADSDAEDESGGKQNG